MLTGKNIKLQALEPSNIEILCQWENDTSIWIHSNTMTPYSRHILEQYISNSHQDIYTTKQLRLMISSINNRMLGCIDLFDFDPNNRKAGVGILIGHKKDRRKGYASEALSILINYAFQTLNLNSLYCNISINNLPSLNLFRKHNFEIVGTKKEWIRNGNEWIDEYLLQLIAPKYLV